MIFLVEKTRNFCLVVGSSIRFEIVFFVREMALSRMPWNSIEGCIKVFLNAWVQSTLEGMNRWTGWPFLSWCLKILTFGHPLLSRAVRVWSYSSGWCIWFWAKSANFLTKRSFQNDHNRDKLKGENCFLMATKSILYYNEESTVNNRVAPFFLYYFVIQNIVWWTAVENENKFNPNLKNLYKPGLYLALYWIIP